MKPATLAEVGRKRLFTAYHWPELLAVSTPPQAKAKAKRPSKNGNQYLEEKEPTRQRLSKSGVLTPSDQDQSMISKQRDA